MKKVKQSNKNNKTQHPIQQNNPSAWKFNEEERHHLKNSIIEKEKILFYAILARDLAAIKDFSEKGFTIPNYKNILKIQFYKNLFVEDDIELLKYLIEDEVGRNFEDINKIEDNKNSL